MDFLVLEQQKENIVPRPGGRPALRLALALKEQAPKSANTAKKNEFEQLIAQQDELDDPLQPYLDYISWTHETYPQGGNAESGLLGLLERCTSCFRDTEFYKNDPRYLRIWLEYGQYSDLPRDVFVYLAKKAIGTELALYYEEFANYLETKGAYGDAMEVYNVGIEREARPLARLQRSFGYFQRRSENFVIKPSSIRNVLSLKRGLPLSSSDPSSSGSGSDRKRPKFAVHCDPDPQSIKDSVFGHSEAPESVPALRLKENVIAARPWAGEVLKQKVSRPPSASFEVFRDSEPQKEWLVSSGLDKYTTIQHPGKPTEKLMLNMALLYPSPNEEYCPLEVFCQNKNFEKQRGREISYKKDGPEERSPQGMTIPLKMDETTPLKPRSPTMTQFSRMTAKEVLGMFNNALRYLDGDTTRFEEHTSNLDGFVTETMHPKEQETGNQGPSTPSTECGSSRSSPFLDRPW